MEKKTFYKVVCIDENDVFEYRILEDVNKDTLDEVHTLLKKILTNIKMQDGFCYLVNCKNKILN